MNQFVQQKQLFLLFCVVLYRKHGEITFEANVDVQRSVCSEEGMMAPLLAIKKSYPFPFIAGQTE